MDIGVSGPNNHAIVAIEKEITVEPIGPCLHGEEEPQESGTVGDHRGGRWRRCSEDEISLHKIERASEKRAQDERQQHPILDGDRGGKRKKIESEIFPVEGIAL